MLSTRALMGTFGYRNGGVRNEFHNLYSLHNKRWEGQVARTGNMTSAYKTFPGKLQYKKDMGVVGKIILKCVLEKGMDRMRYSSVLLWTG
jgi:hypothetical protein